MRSKAGELEVGEDYIILGTFVRRWKRPCRFLRDSWNAGDGSNLLEGESSVFSGDERAVQRCTSKT